MSSDGREQSVEALVIKRDREKWMRKSHPSDRKRSMIGALNRVGHLQPNKVSAHFMLNMFAMMFSVLRCDAKDGACISMPRERCLKKP